MTRRAGLLLGLMVPMLASCGGPGSGAPPWEREPEGDLDLRADLSADSVPLMGELVLRLDLYRRGPADVQLEPAIPDGFRGEVEPPVIRPLSDGIWERRVLRLRPIRTGTIDIPPFRAAVEGGAEVSTSALTVEVTSLLVDAGGDVEAPAPPFPEPVPWTRIALTALAVLAAAVAGILLWRGHRRRVLRAAGQEVPLPPHVRALRELARLRSAPRRSPGEIEAFYVAVSDVLRVYIEERFGLRAPERTTEEFLVEVEGSDSLIAEHRYSLRRFLEQCDLVKFAAVLPGDETQEETFRTAEQFVESTRPDRAREGAA